MDSTNSVKIEVRAKPMLSPTRSLDEGFESDPDRVSTDSEQQQQQQQQHLGNKSSNTNVAAAQQFDILQRTDRDGVTHTQITRRFDNAATSNPSSLSSPSAVTTSNAVADHGSSPDHSSNAAISLICVSGEIDSCAATGTGATEQSSAVVAANHVPPQKPERTRRSKTKAPPPPATSSSRSHSVDTIRYASDAGDLVIRQIDTETINGDVLSGKFVRVQVDPVNQRLDKCSSTSLYSIYPSGSSSLQLWPASSGSNMAVKSANRRWNQQQLHQLLYPHQYIRTSTCGGGSSMGSRHHINRISHPVPAPICWTQSIPRQARR